MAFILVIMALALIGFNVGAIRKEKSSFAGALKRSEENQGDLELKIAQLRQEFAETLLENQTEMEQLKHQMEDMKKLLANAEESSENTKPTSKNDVNKHTQTDDNNKGNNVKVNEIKALLEQELSVEEIAEKLAIGKGEVLLIKELYL